VVSYGGTPGGLAFGRPFFDTADGFPLVSTLSESKLARGWWPCKDRPDDKALVTLSVEAPQELVVVSNGTQAGLPQPSGTRPGFNVTTWRESHPIATYLVSIACAAYDTWEQDYLALDGRTVMPVRYWSFPSMTASAREDWSITPSAIEFYARSFYEYPFLDEKYGHAMFRFGGAMEHQTATSYGSGLVPGDHGYDFVTVHELAHQWFGDHVSPRTFESLWLNEGFATYCQALWVEHLWGLGAYLAEMRAYDYYRACSGEFLGPVHAFIDADGDCWPDGAAGATVYQKGSWVLHMLRWVLGQPSTAPDPEVIFDVLRRHGQAHAYDVASSDDFEATAENGDPGSLAWFFDQWLRRTDRPHYEVGWAAAPQSGGGFLLHLRVTQSQPLPYRMPVLVRLTFPDTSTMDWGPLWNDGAQQDFTLPLAEAPTAVEWDPDGWVLKCVSPVDVDRDDDGWPDWLDGCPDVPNPRQEDLDADGTQDACQAGLDFDGDGRLNEVDCAPADPAAWTPPQDTVLLRVRRQPPDGLVLELSGHPDPMGQAPYATDADFGSLDALRSTRSVEASAVCLVANHPGPELVLAPAPAQPRLFFLAYPWNGCGPVDLAQDPLSACR
jgi:aminopeptidase N